jgi:hypothetical protein
MEELYREMVEIEALLQQLKEQVANIYEEPWRTG